jgi:hypothetical protein
MPITNTDIFALIINVLMFLFIAKAAVPQHNSVLTGSLYYDEIMNTNNENRFRDIVRMDRDTFIKLLAFLTEKSVLTNSIKICAGQKIMIFIHVLAGNSLRQTAERWQHSTSTISLIIHEVSDCIYSQRDILYVKPSPTKIPNEISTNPKNFPFFENCIGALDGTHIPAVVPVEEQANFRNRKGLLTQNVLAICNFDMTFSYVLAGWEGCAHDGKLHTFVLDSCAEFEFDLHSNAD